MGPGPGPSGPRNRHGYRRSSHRGDRCTGEHSSRRTPRSPAEKGRFGTGIPQGRYNAPCQVPRGPRSLTPEEGARATQSPGPPPRGPRSCRRRSTTTMNGGWTEGSSRPQVGAAEGSSPPAITSTGDGPHAMEGDRGTDAGPGAKSLSKGVDGAPFRQPPHPRGGFQMWTRRWTRRRISFRFRATMRLIPPVPQVPVYSSLQVPQRYTGFPRVEQRGSVSSDPLLPGGRPSFSPAFSSRRPHRLRYT
eukprot:jgi/Botrbrau1/23327/Bobra.0102s0061.1